MKKRQLLFLISSFLLSLVAPVHLCAENNETKAQINRIKADSSYIGAESTQADWETAYMDALTSLKVFVEHDKRWEGKEITLPQLHELVNQHYFSHPRAELCRVFVYVSKADIDSLLEQSNPQISEERELNEIIDSLTGIKTIEEACIVIQSYLSGNKIHKFEPCDLSSEQQIGTCLIIYNESGALLALLVILEDGEIGNFATQTYDQLSNYKGCRAFRFY